MTAESELAALERRADQTSQNYLVQAEITRAAFEGGPDAIIVVNHDGTIIAANVQAELISGLPRTEMIGCPIETLIPERLRDRHRNHRAGYIRMPYRRLMGPGLDLAIVQRVSGGHVELPVDVNLAPAVISIGTVVVATIRPHGGWGSPAPP